MSVFQQIRKRPLPSAVLTVLVPSLLGLIVAQQVEDTELRKALYAASVTLIFGGFFGGLLKILFDDFTLTRQRRQDNAQFVANVLNDLKSVYDRVGRVRILIPAHRSAKTYGAEMRDLIDARVTLRNVVRALQRRTEGLSETARSQVSAHVVSMEQYLEKLTSEFRSEYKRLSNHQRVYEARVDAGLKATSGQESADQASQPDDMWAELQKLKEVQGLIDESDSSPYRREFEAHLDEASGVLRQELRRILAGEEAERTKTAS